MSQRILVVEDSPTQAAEIAFVLEDAGFAVEVATDGHEGLRHVRSAPCDLVLADVLMPGMSGFELCRKIKQETPDKPVFLVTTLNTPPDILRGLACGADSYLNKPYEPEDLIQRIQSFFVSRERRAADGKANGSVQLPDGDQFIVPSRTDQVLDYLLSVFEHFARVQRSTGEGALRAAEALRRSEERFALAASGAKHGLWDWDLEKNELYLSPHWKEILGLEGGERGAGPDQWLMHIHPEDRPRVENELASHLEGRSPHFESEHRLRRADGSDAWVLARGRAVRDSSGRAYRIAGSIEDFSECKRTQEELVAVSEELALLLRTSPDLYIRLNGQGVIADYLAGTDGEVRIDPADFRGRHVTAVLPADVAGRFATALSRLRESRAPLSIEYTVPAAGGPQLCEARLLPLGAEQALVVIRDVTQRRREDTRLRLAQFAADRAPDPICWLAPNSRFLYVNDAACRALGQAREALLATTLRDLDPTLTPQEWFECWNRTKEGKGAFLQSNLRARDGRIVPLAVRTHHLALGGNEYVCAFMRPRQESVRAPEAFAEFCTPVPAAVVCHPRDAV